jgi:hypothetical protein
VVLIDPGFRLEAEAPSCFRRFTMILGALFS